MFLIFLEHLYATNHHAFNANWKSFFAVLIVKKHYAYYNIAIIMYHSDRKSPDNAVSDASLIL